MALLSPRWGRGRIVTWSSALALLWASTCVAQQPARITSEIDNTVRTTVSARRPSLERADDLGGVPGGTILSGASIVFRRSDEQEARLQAIIAAQQDPGSPSYHKWFTPDQFAANFGMADSDIAKITAWLKQQGFAVDSIARSKNRIAFSGTVDRINATFGAQMHYYNVGGVRRYAPSNDISLPSSIAPVVITVANLDNFRPKPHVQVKKNFTSSQTGDHFLTPKDVDTIYDVTPAYTAGYTGADQSIAIAGQSEIDITDIENFQKAAGLTVKDPTLVLVPGSGAATISSGDEAESDLDVEYSGGIATGANIYLVYVGNSANYSAFDAITYAVDSRIASIISSSYGDCETDLGPSSYAAYDAVLEQAASQGQTVIAASGDDGSTDCFGDSDLSTTQQQALAVDFPASSQYVTGMGGTEFPSADVAASNTTYWTAANGTDVISSALSYIPEQVWNDDSLLTSQNSVTGLSSGGGGVSTLTSRPAWQTGVAGISAGSFRLVPDISLDASSNNSGYLFCSSDSTDTGVTGSCANGFRDTNDTYLTVAGGTSFDAPIFAGMVAIINQKLNSVGQGTINSTLYTLAANSATYASAFHDITSGGNQCAAGSTYCSSAGESEYAAGTGYDSASGLGSIDFYNLLSVWPAGSSSFLDTSKTVLTAATPSPAAGASDRITITVSSDSTSSTAIPTGTVSIAVDGTTTNASLALSNGAATYSFSSNVAGSHTIVATYSGDSTFAGSMGTVVVAVGGVSNGGSFSVTAANLTVTDGATGTATITVTPANGYTGTISWAVYPNTTVADACYTIANTVISGTAAATAQLNIDTNGSNCTTGGFVRGAKARRLIARGAAIGSSVGSNVGSIGSQRTTVNSIAEASFGLAFILGFTFNLRRRKQAIRKAIILTIFIGVLAGCGGSSTSTTTTTEYATKGTYTLTVVGTDTVSSSTTASATMTLTID